MTNEYHMYRAGSMANSRLRNRISMGTDETTSNLLLLPYQRNGHSITENETLVVYDREKNA